MATTQNAALQQQFYADNASQEEAVRRGLEYAQSQGLDKNQTIALLNPTTGGGLKQAPGMGNFSAGDFDNYTKKFGIDFSVKPTPVPTVDPYATTRDEVSNLYRSVLGREPDAEGLAYWTNQFGESISPDENALWMSIAKPTTAPLSSVAPTTTPTPTAAPLSSAAIRGGDDDYLDYEDTAPLLSAEELQRLNLSTPTNIGVTKSTTGAPVNISSQVGGLSLFPNYVDLEAGQKLEGYTSAPVDYEGSSIKATGDMDGNLTGYEGIRQVRVGNNDGIAIDTYDTSGNLVSSIVDLDVGNKDTHVVTTYDAAGNITDKRVYQDTSNSVLRDAALYAASLAIPGAAPFVQGLNAVKALEQGNILGAIASGAGALGGAGFTIPTELTDTLKYVNAAQALASGDPSQILSAAASLTGSSDLKVASAALNAVQAIQSGNPTAMLGAVKNLSNIVNAATQTTKAADPNAEMTMYLTGINAGMSEDDAMAFAKSMTSQAAGTTGNFARADRANDLARERALDSLGLTGDFARMDRANETIRRVAGDAFDAVYQMTGDSNLALEEASKAAGIALSKGVQTGAVTESTLLPESDKDDFAYLGERVDRPVIGNDKAATPEEAADAARKINPAASGFSWNGKDYTLTTPTGTGGEQVLAQLNAIDGIGIVTDTRADRPIIKNDEANTPEEAAALARVRNPAASGFTFGGQEYTMTVPTGAGGEQTRRQLVDIEIANAPTRNEAFALARKEYGPNHVFEWQGKKYTTEIKANDLGPVPGSKEGDVLGGTPGSLKYLFDPAAYETEEKANAAIDAINARNLSIQSSSAWDKRTNQPISAVDKALHSIADTIRSTEKVVGAAGTQYGTSVAGLMSRLDQALIPPEYLANPTEFQDRQKELFEYRNNALKDLTPTQRDIANGLSSGALTLTGAVAGGIPAAIGLTVADVANSTWNDGVSRNLSDEQNIKRTVTMAGIELVMESLGASTLKTILAPVISKLTTAEAIQSGIKPYLKAFGGQQLEEFTTNFMQDLADRSETLGGVNVGEPLDVNQVLDLAKSSFISTTAAMGVIGIGGAAKTMLSPQQIDAINQIEAPEGDTKSILNEKLSTLPPSYFQGLNPIEPETVQFIQSKAVNDPSFLSTLRSNVAGLAMSFGAATAAPTTNIDFSTPTTQIAETAGNATIDAYHDVNKDLTQDVLGGVVGGGTQTATAPVIVAEGHPATTAGTDASTAGGTTTAPTVGGTTTAPAGTTTTGVTGTTAPAGTVETISQTDSAVDAANNVILNTNQTVTDALSSGADVSTTVSDAISNATSLGADANSVVSNVVATSLGAGADLDQVVSSAVNVSSNVSTGADLNLTLGNIVASAVNSGADITSVVNAVSNAAAAAGQNVSVDQIGNVVTIDNNRDGTRTVIYTDSNTVSSVNDLTGTRTEISTDAATNTQTTAVSDANTNTTTVVNNNTGATTQTVVDNNTGTTTETKTDPAAGTSTTTNVDNNTGVTTQTTVNNNTGVTTETVANNNTGVTTQTTVDNNTEVTTETVVDSNTNVTTETKTDSTNNTTTETIVDNNTGVTTQTTVDNNTGSTTETKVDNNTGVTTQTTVDNNTGVTTETVVDSNSNITTETKTDSNTNTSVVVVTDLNTNTQVTTVVDTDSGIITSQNIDVAPPEWEPPVIEPPVIEPPVVEPPVIEPPVVVDPPVIENPVIEPPVVEPPVVEPPVVEPPVVEPPVVKPPVVKPPVVEPPPPSPKMLLAGAPALGVFGPDIGRLAPTFLKSWETQKRIDPLAQFEKERREAEMIQQIDPRLLMMLQQRSQESEERPYYAYGQEESIDDILGNKEEEDVELKTGGYVAPLNKSMPLMSKAGGALSHYREDFRHGKHVAGKGDGQSDDIPAWLADSEFVLPADVVAALGNGSTKAGTNKLYEMMYAIRERARSTGPKDLPPPALKSPLDYLKRGNKK